MKKSYFGETKVFGEVIESVTCNMCGKSMEVIKDFGVEPHDVFEQYLNINVCWKDCLKITEDINQKYKRGSKTYSLDICWECFNKIMDMCLIPPTIRDF